MSSSYFETVGRQAGMTPQVGDDLAYKDTEGDQVKNIGEQAKELEKDHSDFIQQRINDFNAQHTRDMKTLGRIIEFVPTAMKGVQKLQDMNDEIADYKRLEAVGQSLVEDSSLETEDGILNVDLYGEAGQLEVEGAPRFLSRMTLTAANSQAGANDRQVANRIATNVPGYFSQGIGDIRLPSEDGPIGWNEILDPEQANQFLDINSAMIIAAARNANPTISDRVLRKHLMPKINAHRKVLLQRWEQTQESAFRASLKTSEQLQIWDSANNPTTALSGAFGATGYIQKKAAYYNKLSPGSGMKLAKNEWTENMETGILSGYVLPDQVDSILTTPFKAKDGSFTTFEKLDPINARKLRSAVAKFESGEAEAVRERIEAEEKKFVFEYITNYEGPKDEDYIKNITKAWRTNFNNTKYPAELKNLYTVGFEDELAKVERLEYIASQGGIVTNEDISTIINPDLLTRAQKAVTRATLESVPDDIEKEAKKLIKANVAQHTFENDLSKATTPKFVAIERQAYKGFRAKFAELKGNGASDSTAQSGAEDFVISQIKANKFDELPEYSPANAAGKAINTFKTASIVQPDIISSNTAIAGEKPYLDAAEAYFKSDFKIGSLPEYYTLASKQYKNLDPHDLARIRLESTGRLPKKAKSEYEEVDDSNLLTHNNTSSKTLRAAFTGSNMSYVLNRVVNPKTRSNGGYNAVKKNGKYVKLQKPLKDHTIAEVLALYNMGFDNFGMYDFTGAGLLSVLQARTMPFELTDKFDEQIQSALIVGRLRQKIALGKVLNGDPTFRRQVNIPKADMDQFMQIVGFLPPMNQLDNLLPAVAKALVDDKLK
jgi:hypothetical protein